MNLPPVRRVITGHAADGRAVVTADGALPTVVPLAHIPGTVFHEIWSTAASPAAIDNAADPTLGPLTLSPPASGSRIRMVDIPPDSEALLAHGAANMRQAFASIGESQASTVTADSPHPLMHRTETVDYGVVLSGEITLVLDDSELALKAGDVVIQRGTNHAWANRSGQSCRMLFVLLAGDYEPEIRRSLAGR
ncbi:cupin domain-containing protein [Vogesella sp. GCM10023246]|uniref:Cupin domain-containing protein n=1 Tax=Vogesella oryzagri TaxID=3160864 RepID=A0ABV1M4T9_9NEIS